MKIKKAFSINNLVTLIVARSRRIVLFLFRFPLVTSSTKGLMIVTQVVVKLASGGRSCTHVTRL